MRDSKGSKRGFAVGAHVVVDGSGPVIHEVLCARLANGGYAYLVAPVTPSGPDRAAFFEVAGTDLKEVGR